MNLFKRFWRWVQEECDPKLRCWRRGHHDYKTVIHDIMYRPDGTHYRSVAQLHEASRKECRTCYHRHKAGWIQGKFLTSYNGIEMDSSKMQLFEKQGWILW